MLCLTMDEGWNDKDRVRKLFQAAAEAYEERRRRRLRIALKICLGLLAADLLVILGLLLKWIFG